MATVKITSEGGAQEFPVDVMVRLQAEVEGGQASEYSWKRDGVNLNKSGSQHEFKMSADTKGSYTVVATVDTRQLESDPFPVNLKAAEPGETPAPAPGQAATEEPPILYPWFAAIAAVVAAAAGWLILRDLFNHRAGFSETDWNSLESRLKAGTALGTTIMVLGGVVLLVGLWMAVVEWRGRFAKKEPGLEPKGVVEEAPKIIEAIGKLKGPALTMVVGAVLMLAAAWVAQSAASPSPSPSPTPSASPT